MTDPAPLPGHRVRATLLSLAAALATALPVTAPGAAHAEQIPRYTLAFELRNHATGKCLEVADWRTDRGAPVRQWTCTGGANQQWTANSNTLLFNKHSSLCLDVPGAGTVWGTQVIQWECGLWTRPANQRWNVPGVNTPSTGYLASDLRLVLDVPGSDPADGTPVVTWGANGGANQTWTGLQPPIDHF
ncbi:RICIN domain-containing protein [Kitasatospora sp. NPDC059327]|uniref:RICIN domain-containing protein n=1 Tax=Kitasatospora sp. NPDC059327 TaxID=3346803 RepID=UPI003698AF7E